MIFCIPKCYQMKSMPQEISCMLGYVARVGKVVYMVHINGLVQERRNSSAWAVELRHSCTNWSIAMKVRVNYSHYYES